MYINEHRSDIPGHAVAAAVAVVAAIVVAATAAAVAVAVDAESVHLAADIETERKAAEKGSEHRQAIDSDLAAVAPIYKKSSSDSVHSMKEV